MVSRKLFVAAAFLLAVACKDTPTGRNEQSGESIAAAPDARANHVDSSSSTRRIFGFNDATAANNFPFRPFSAWGNGDGMPVSNPTCEDLGLVGIKIDSSGTAAAGTMPVYVTVNGGSTLVGTVTVVTADGITWDWTSTFGIDAVISKGGIDDDGGHIYVYSPDAVGDNGLFSGLNQSGQRQGISHVNFCFNLDPEAAIATDPYARRTWDWAIDKSTNQGDMTLNKGVGATVTYSIIATPSGPVDSDWRLDGTVKLRNDFAFAIAITNPQFTVNGNAVTTSCPTDIIPGGNATAPGILTCSFSTPLANANAGTVAFTANAVAPEVNDLSAITDYTFTAADFEEFNATATVQDFFNGAGPVDVNGVLQASAGIDTLTYEATIPASDVCDIQTIVNKAVLHTPTTGSQGGLGADLQRRDSVSFDKKVIGCIGISVTANPTFDRTYVWSIDKTASHETVNTTSGQEPVVVTYSVTVTPTSTDGNYAVTGVVTVKNEATYPAVINVTGVVTCTTALLPANGTEQCAYNLANPNPAGGTVTASATVESSAPVTASATYAFTDPNLIGAQADVFDTFGTDAEVSLGSAFQTAQTFTYTKPFGGLVCGTNTYPNTARFASNNGGSGSDSWTVTHNITGCSTGTGCTLTQGYWKTHSKKGPAAHTDAGWNLVGPLAEDEIFYLSGRTWYQVFWTAPMGNQYYVLAHQFMAATLNVLNGASAPANVATALADAKAFFLANGPVMGPSGKWKGKDAAQLAAMSALLDAYNNGVGPGHCDENPIITK